MTDWHRGRRQTFAYYEVDPSTWRDRAPIAAVTGCTIDREADGSLLESASIEVDEDVTAERYVRVYLVTEQRPYGGHDRVSERTCLGTFLVQTPSATYDGRTIHRTLDAYSPLLELRDDVPPAGYTLAAGTLPLQAAAAICRDACHAPVVSDSPGTALAAAHTAADGDTWLDVVTDLLSYEGREVALDQFGRIVFAPKRQTAALAPVWTFADDNSSILEAEVTEEYDWYGLPNVVEAVWSSPSRTLVSRAVNDSPNSPLSTVSRGRRVVYRIDSPEVSDDPTQEELDEYAVSKLREMSSVERTVTYTHGYCPVRVGDAVRLDYRAHGLDVRARVVSQRITCETDCPVQETAVYTENLWR